MPLYILGVHILWSCMLTGPYLGLLAEDLNILRA